MSRILYLPLASIWFMPMPQESAAPTQQVLSIRKLAKHPAASPASASGVTLEVIEITGASVMHQDVDVKSIGDSDVECDVVEFVLSNQGSQMISFDVHQECPSIPVLSYEVFDRDAWTGETIYFDSRGKRCNDGYLVAARQPVKTVTLESGDLMRFRMNVERWRLSLASKIRVSLQVRSGPSGSRESVVSNAWSTVLAGS